MNEAIELTRNLVTPQAMVLLVEDDFIDVEIVNRSVKKRGLPVDIQSFCDATTALEFLRQKLTDVDGGQESLAYQGRIVIFLDINMPGMNGHEFLKELRSDPLLKRILVFMLTTSEHPRDLQQAFDQHVAGYFTKSRLDGLLTTLETYLEHGEFPILK